MKKPDQNRLHLVIRACSLLPLLLLPCISLAAGIPRHDITISLDPAKHSLSATDTITLPSGLSREFTVALHAGLTFSSPDPAVRIVKKGSRQGAVPLDVYAVMLPEGANKFTVLFSGTIEHPLVASRNQARSFDEMPGTIGDEGIYLAGSSAWYPVLDSEFMTFTLTVELPVGWDAVSQGGRTVHQPAKIRDKGRLGLAGTAERDLPDRFPFLPIRKTRDGVTAQVLPAGTGRRTGR